MPVKMLAACPRLTRSAVWRAVTWPISWPITEANSASFDIRASRPRVT
jgi:hypothetical protein